MPPPPSFIRQGFSYYCHNVTKNLTGHRMHIAGPQMCQINHWNNSFQHGLKVYESMLIQFQTSLTKIGGVIFFCNGWLLTRGRREGCTGTLSLYYVINGRPLKEFHHLMRSPLQPWGVFRDVQTQHILVTIILSRTILSHTIRIRYLFFSPTTDGWVM